MLKWKVIEKEKVSLARGFLSFDSNLRFEGGFMVIRLSACLKMGQATNKL